MVRTIHRAFRRTHRALKKDVWMPPGQQPAAAATQSIAEPSPRLVFLDVLRGMTIAFMILVNNNGSEPQAYWPLKHAEWNGWTPTDIVFPVFLFLVGIAIVLSVSSRIKRGDSKAALTRHAVKRAAILFALGVVIHGLPHYAHLSTLRFYGVLQRIAICYLICTLLYLWSQRVATLVTVTAICLLGYWVLMRWVPIPGFGIPGRDFPFTDQETNWVSVVDRRLFPHRLLEGTRDPLGLLSTIPAIATCTLGMLCGLWLRSMRSARDKITGLVAQALVGFALGLLWSHWFPINKRLWTSSYVLFAAGWTLLLLAVCYLVIDLRKHQGAWTFPWKVFGSNAIFAYAFSELLSIAMGVIPVRGVGLHRFLYANFFSHIVSPAFGSLLYSLCFVLVCFFACLLLYRKRIFIKV